MYEISNPLGYYFFYCVQYFIDIKDIPLKITEIIDPKNFEKILFTN